MLAQALAGKTILDFSLLLPGPLATKMMAQLGAKVIKIESPNKKDDTRLYPPFRDGKAVLYELLNQNKEQKLIDYRSPKGREAVLQLAKEADVVIEQFRPKAMEAWGLGYEDFKRVNPNIIYCSLTGYGQTGPYHSLAGHDLNYLATTGLLDLNRDDNGKPIIPGVQLADIAGGTYMLLTACLAALVQGKGQYIDVAMLDGIIPLLSIPMAQLWGNIDPHQIQLLHGGLVNYNVYECQCGRWVALGALEVRFWNTFCQLVGKPSWKRKHFSELSVHTFPKEEITKLFLSKPRKEWIAIAQQEDCCLSPILKINEIADDQHIAHRQYFADPLDIVMPWMR